MFGLVFRVGVIERGFVGRGECGSRAKGRVGRGVVEGGRGGTRSLGGVLFVPVLFLACLLLACWRVVL